MCAPDRRRGGSGAREPGKRDLSGKTSTAFVGRDAGRSLTPRPLGGEAGGDSRLGCRQAGLEVLHWRQVIDELGLFRILLTVLAVTLGLCLLARVPCLIACQPGASAIHALVQPLEAILGTVQHGSLVLSVGERGIAVVVCQEVEVLLTEVSLQLTTFGQSLALIRDAVSFVRDALAAVRDVVSFVRDALSAVRAVTA
jgi:hypothetical protein